MKKDRTLFGILELVILLVAIVRNGLVQFFIEKYPGTNAYNVAMDIANMSLFAGLIFLILSFVFLRAFKKSLKESGKESKATIYFLIAILLINFAYFISFLMGPAMGI